MEKKKRRLSNPIETINCLTGENAALKEEIRNLVSSANSARFNPTEEPDCKESENRFQTIFESSRFGNKIITADLKIIQVNPALVALLGYSNKEDIIGTRILDYSPVDQKKHWQTLQEKLWKKDSPSFNLETALLKKDGSLVWCHVTSILFQDKGETFGYTIIEDITEQRELRVQKEEFINVASHELKTPLTSLKAGLQLLNRKIKSEAVITASHIQLAQSAENNTTRLSNLVVDLLNSTKIEQGQLTLNKSRFKLSDILNECCNHILLDRKYYLTTKGDLSLEVIADQQKIEQVLVNLVNNAAKYAPDSEEIVIQVEGLEDRVKVSVTDRGNGISAENKSHLFDRYYRVNNDGNLNSGLGLGLYISSEIIRRHGGEIGVESKLGQGSTFWFTIPVKN
ncbi:PAS domain-containing sensor histidine kinase [Mucilaginibacter arboris]|uniref:histidine kinase n=1 Tax=Mucilaginibacter arboris TaxID=2682090 RepID=A0A7K1T085_9SPHI|nr:ATP-binding protein [Mucilaginibacter arboris]MVN22963.1 PAS domain S-box protein [Mucilaginibacter arboris]